MKRVLIIDDDTVSLTILKNICLTRYQVTVAGSVSQAKRVVVNEKIDIVLTDYTLGDGSVVDVLKYMARGRVDLPVIVISKYSDYRVLESCWENGAFDFIEKPIQPRQLFEVMDAAEAHAPPYFKTNLKFQNLLQERQENPEFILRAKTLNEELNGDTKVLSEVLNSAKKELTAQWAQIDSLLEGNQIGSLVPHLLKMEEIARTIHAEQLAGCLRDVQAAIQRGEVALDSDLGRLRTVIDGLFRRIDSVLGEVRSHLFR